ncbi:MAG: tetratricopeptide repeat protein [Planctomycetia bacterium]
MSQQSASSERRSRNSESQRVSPSFVEITTPGNFFQFCLGLLECWFFSRDYNRLWVGLPFLALLALPVGMWFWIRGTTTITLLKHYEQVAQSAVDQKNLRLQETALLAMCGLQPSDYSYRMRLGRFYNETDRAEAAYQEIASLAPEAGEGSVDARLWIVQQALSDKPIRPLTSVELEKQLRMIVEAQPNNAVAHGLLATEYLKRKEFLLAERHLLEAAKGNPERGLELAQLQIALKRPRQEIDAAADKAIASLTRMLEKDPANIEASANLVRALVLKAEIDKARSFLLAARTQFPDHPSLKSLQAELDLLDVEKQMQTSGLNRDLAVLQTYKALEYDPASALAVEILLGLKSMGAEISAEKLKNTTEYWKAAADRTPNDPETSITFARVCLLTGDFSGAVQAVRSLAEKNPELQVSLAELLLKAGAIPEGEGLLNSVVKWADENRQRNPNELKYWAIQGDALILLKQPDAVRELVKSSLPAETQSLTPKDQVLLDLYGRASLVMFDALTGFDPAIIPRLRNRNDIVLLDAPPDQLLLLLEDARKNPRTVTGSVERLCLLCLSTHRAAPEAEAAITKLRVHGPLGITAISLLGAYSVAVQEYSKAVPFLEQSNIINRGRDPVVLNNLAVAIIRGEPEEKERALGQINQAMALVPENSDILTTRGEIYVAMERWEDALKDLARALELREGNFETHQMLERTYRGLGNAEKADQHQKRAEEILAEQASTSP